MVTNGLNWALQGAAKVPVLVNKIGVVHENEVDMDTVHFGTDLELGQDGQERGRLPFCEAEGMRATPATTRSLQTSRRQLGLGLAAPRPANPQVEHSVSCR